MHIIAVEIKDELDPRQKWMYREGGNGCTGKGGIDGDQELLPKAFCWRWQMLVVQTMLLRVCKKLSLCTYGTFVIRESKLQNKLLF